MESLIPTNEYTEVDGRAYANPQVALDESNSFIDNLRATQGQQNQEITKQTQNLGTSVPTSLGGLTGAESYFTSRYQTPQTNVAVSNLRATAQAAALNQALQNEQEIWKKKYQDSYRAYQKRQYDASKTPQNPSTTDNTTTDNTTIEIDSATPEGLMNQMYIKKFQEYKKQGYSNDDAEAKARADLGLDKE